MAESVFRTVFVSVVVVLSCSPRRTSRLATVLLAVQWAAVNTYLLLIKDPPQKMNVDDAPVKAACHGYSFTSVFTPLIILDPLLAWPHLQEPGGGGGGGGVVTGPAFVVVVVVVVVVDDESGIQQSA